MTKCKRLRSGSRTIPIYAALLFFVLVLAVSADSTEDVNHEIDHLLQFIESSGCTFIRNNKEGSSAKARAHIQKKYNYIKDRVKTTEDFIKQAATKSSMSGKPYKIRCSGKEILLADWLNAELQRLRMKDD
jgi:hypothetical protein